jgi:hypothetical protein
MSNIPLIGLKADQFRHPLDLEATSTLKQLPGLDLIVRQLLGQLGEQFFMLENLASSVQVGENQLPHLHQLLVEPAKLWIWRCRSFMSASIRCRMLTPLRCGENSLLW